MRTGAALESLRAAGTPPVALSLEHIRKVYFGRKGGVVEAVSGISLELRQGEVVAVVGPSGCGKSTLLRIVGGLDSDFTGSVSWSNAAPRDRLACAIVFQSDSTLPWMTVERNVAVGLSGLTLSEAEISARVAKYLALVGLADFRRAYPHELSGGMRQRVAIARALATEPMVLLMDEPLAALDAQTRLIMQQELLRIWREARLSVFYITHDIAEALGLAHRVVVMSARPGRVKAIFETPFQGARDVMEVRRHPEFGALEMDIWRQVADEVGSSLR